jgi:hypothetical protein
MKDFHVREAEQGALAEQALAAFEAKQLAPAPQTIPTTLVRKDYEKAQS